MPPARRRPWAGAPAAAAAAAAADLGSRRWRGGRRGRRPSAAGGGGWVRRAEGCGMAAGAVLARRQLDRAACRCRQSEGSNPRALSPAGTLRRRGRRAGSCGPAANGSLSLGGCAVLALHDKRARSRAGPLRAAPSPAAAAAAAPHPGAAPALEIRAVAGMRDCLALEVMSCHRLILGARRRATWALAAPPGHWARPGRLRFVGAPILSSGQRATAGGARQGAGCCCVEVSVAEQRGGGVPLSARRGSFLSARLAHAGGFQRACL